LVGLGLKVAASLKVQLQLVSGWLTLDLPRMVHEAELAFARLGLYRDEGCIPCFVIPRDELPKWAELVGEFRYMLEGSPTECSECVQIEATDLMGMAYCAAQNKVVDIRVVRAVSWALIVLLAFLPNIVRSRCLWLSSFSTDDGAKQHHLCPSTDFFGTGAFANTFSGLNVLLAAAYAIPLTLFFATLLVANMRLFSCCQLYGRLIRSDVRSLQHYAALDFTVRKLGCSDSCRFVFVEVLVLVVGSQCRHSSQLHLCAFVLRVKEPIAAHTIVFFSTWQVPSNILAWIRSLQGLHHFGEQAKNTPGVV
jgi:hypothetical protein